LPVFRAGRLTTPTEGFATDYSRVSSVAGETKVTRDMDETASYTL